MDALIVPDYPTLQLWLERLSVPFFKCDDCEAFHLFSTDHTDDSDNDVIKLKLNLSDNVLFYIAFVDIKPSTLMAIMAELSSLNNASATMKTFLDLQDDRLPRLVLCQAISVGAGLSFSQFDHFIAQTQEQLTQMLITIQEYDWLIDDVAIDFIFTTRRYPQLH